MTQARDLADRFHLRWLEENPFAASMYGIPGYDDLMPDESEEGARAWRGEVVRFLGEADAVALGALTPADAVTLDCAREAGVQELAGIDLARAEYTVTPMQYAGPAMLMAVAARTVLLDPAGAEAYLARLRRSGVWLDQLGERLRAGAGRAGFRSPRLWNRPSPGPRGCWPRPPPHRCCPPAAAGVAGTAAWESERRAVAEEVVTPALARWVAPVRELLPRARPSDQAGLVYLPGGEEDYARRSGSTRRCRCARNCTRPGWIASPRWRRGRWSWARDWGFPGWTRSSPRCATQPGSSRGRGHRRGGGRGAAGRGPGGGVLPAAASAAVRCDADARGGGRERRRAALHSAADGRRPGGDVLVQHRAAHRRNRMGHRGGGLRRSGTRASPAALPPAAARRAARAPAPAEPARCSPRAGACTPSSSPRKQGFTLTIAACSARSAPR